MNRVNRLKGFMAALVLLTLGIAALPDTAQGCQRCGLFGRLCRYQTTYSKSYVPVQQVAAVVQQPDLLVVQNNYPQPIAAQGQTVYGYQAASLAYSVNPAEVIRQAAELSKAASVTAQIGLTGFNQTAQTQLQLQAAIAEPLVRGQAAAQVLNAAGLSQSFTKQETLALKISRGDNGQFKVEPLTLDQVTAKIEASIGGGTSQPPDAPTQPQAAAPRNPNSILAQKCASCHGLNLTEPKGSAFIDAGHELDCDLALKSIQLIKAGKMPKDGSLTPAEKEAAIDELLSLYKPSS